MRLLITCPYGFVSTLNQELKFLGYKPCDSFDTGTYVDTDLMGMMTINLRSRIASKVFIQMNEGTPCTTFDQLFTITQTIQRTKRLPASEFLQVTAHCYQSTLMSEKSTQAIVHKAILTQLMAHGQSIMTPTKHPYEIIVQIINNKATFFLNSSGEGLHRRGYRLDQGEAPLKENVAAGLVLMSGRRWQQHLRDPCCGSGTICIEAAMIARNSAPGAHRAFSFFDFTTFDSTQRTALKKTAETKSYPDKQFHIFGSDNDPDMFDKARKNAERAGVADTIQFLTHDLVQTHEKTPNNHSGTDHSLDVSPPNLPVIFRNLQQKSSAISSSSGEIFSTNLQTSIITNPPYGKRLSPDGLKELYRALINLSNEPHTHLTCITNFPDFPNLLTSHRPRKEVKNGADDVYVRMKPRG